MKKIIKSELVDDLRPEYDMKQLLKNSVRGKHYKDMLKGYTIKIHKSDGTTAVKHIKPVSETVVLAPDVFEYFPDSEAVNKALRSLIALAQVRQLKNLCQHPTHRRDPHSCLMVTQRPCSEDLPP